ncbi:hypothetical protein D9M69_711760 [compost metagenome]
MVLRSSACAMAWRTFRLSKGGLALLVASTVSPSVPPIVTLSFGSALSCGTASGAERLVWASTSPARSAATCACGSDMKRKTALASAGFSPQ